MTSPDTQPKSGRGMRVLLFVSLAMNVLFLAAVFSAFVGVRYFDRHPPRVDRLSAPFTAALGRKDRKVIFEKMRGRYEDQRRTRADIRAENERMILLLRAVPYDHAPVQALVMDRIDDAHDRFRIGSELFLEQIKGFSDAERTAYADRLQDTLKRDKYRKDKRDKKRD